jgi:mono/diheme cytochrome c family protein
VKAKAWVAAALGCIYFGSPPVSAEQSAESGAAARKGHALFEKYCFDCHNTVDWAGGLAFDTLSFSDIPAEAETWEKIVRQLRTRSMPPAGKPRPNADSYDSFAGFLETQLDAAAAAKPNPGRPAAVHRLNRAEYTNAIRDLLALDVDGESLLPADEAGAGFDNSGQILSVSALLMERYLIAARQISRTAVGDPTLRPVARTFVAPSTDLQTARQSEDLPFGSRGSMAVKYDFPLDGEYVVKIRLLRTKGIEGPRIIGLGEPRQLDVRLDGTRIKLFTIGGEKDRTPEQVEESLEARFSAKAGTRLVGVTFLDEALAPEGMLRPQLAEAQIKGWGPRDDSRRPPGVESVSINGPFNAHVPASTPSRDRIFVCHAQNEACAKQILSNLARRAYRRPVTDADIEPLLAHFRTGRDAQQDGNAFDAGIRMALEGILVSPDFLFRFELDPPQATAAVTRINDVELASRLSFFLWSSIPDEELLQLAIAGKLQNPSVLEQQVRRMLADPRSAALVDNFFGQWLGLRNVKSQAPDTIAFPEFDDALRAAFEQETALLFASMLREDRSVIELLSADYTYVNERLARHYGIPNVYGSRFRRVTLTDENRWGILGKGAILLVTSLPNRTSPVLRGKWVLENVMGAPPPPPPPNVPPFPESKDTDFTRLTVRQKLEQHRANPNCAACHARMDPVGFAFDNFDPVGHWRNVETEVVLASPELPILYNPIDASGQFLDGRQFHGPAELRRILLQNPASFAHVVAEKLLTYALGRGLEYYDQPAIRTIVRNAASDDYRWSSLILEIVKSAPFRMRASAARADT